MIQLNLCDPHRGLMSIHMRCRSPLRPACLIRMLACMSALSILSACIPGGGGGGATSNPANLQNLEVTSNAQSSKSFSPSPAFNAEVSEYRVTVGSDVPSVMIIPTVADKRATVKVNNQPAVSGQPFGPINLIVGINQPVVILVDAPGASKTYTISITRAASTQLSGLLVSAGALQEKFEQEILHYTVQAPFTTLATTIIASTVDGNASITINGQPVGSGVVSQPISLSVGQTTITIVVSAPSVASTAYSITVTRVQGSSNANLSGLTISPGTLQPAFSPSTDMYAISINNPTSTVTVTATVQDPTSTIQINSDPVTSGQPFAVTVPVGASPITILVIPQNGTPKAYAITINRALPGNANLSSLATGAGTLTPGFNPSTLTYALNVLNPVTTVSITATLQDPTSTMTINGHSVASGTPFPINNLIVGNTTVTIVVTANPAGNNLTYRITIVRSGSGNATLSALQIFAGTTAAPPALPLSPAFASGTVSYTVGVLNPVANVTVVPTAVGTVTVNGQSVASGGALTLQLGAAGSTTTINIVVTAVPEGNQQTYTVGVSRAAAGNASLSALEVYAGTTATPPPLALSPVFAPGTTSYSLSVLNPVTSVAVKPTAASGTSTLTVNGQSVASGGSLAVALNAPGTPTSIAIAVTAIEGNNQTYTVTINRLLPGDASLSGLIVTPGAMTPAFNSATLSYSVTVTNTDTQVTVTATMASASSTLTINNQAVANGTPLNVNLGLPGTSTPVEVAVTAVEGNAQTYTIAVNRPL